MAHDTHLEYKDDSYTIPRSTSVIAKRMPASRPGRGRAAIYVANVGQPTPGGGAPADKGGPASNSSGGQFGSGGGRFQGTMSKRFDGRDAKPPPAPTAFVSALQCSSMTSCTYD